jgi:glutaredoxin/glutathione-dependent peroxiredoxin
MIKGFLFILSSFHHFMIQLGDTLPDGTLYVLSDGDPKPVTIRDICKGKKIVIFGLPGAYTTVCSNKQVPQYNEKLSEFKSAGIDQVYCVSVNDAFVMDHWKRDLGVDDELCMLADGEAAWHKEMGLTQHLQGLGKRALRYSMIVDDGKVVSLHVENPGPTCYTISGPSMLLQDLA